MSGVTDVIVSGLEFYKVARETPIELRVVVGEGQPGGTSYTCVEWSGQITDDAFHSIGNEGDDLSGSTLHCVTTVKDQSDVTDRTSVTYTLRGGPAEEAFPFKADARQDRGLVIYSIRFFLLAEDA